MTSREPRYDKVEAGVGPNKDADDPNYDEELEQYGGPFKKKIAVGQVTIRLPLKMTCLNLVALSYGFLPWIVPMTFAIHYIVTRHFLSLWAIGISLSTMIVNEVLLKPIIRDPRPKQSANKHSDGTMKHGMPSGHVLNATSIMVWALLETSLRGPGLDERHRPLSCGFLILIMVLMAPVPWARWYNMDHSVAQCAVSLVIGTIVGVSAFFIRIKYYRKHWKPWDDIHEVGSYNFTRL